MVKKCKSQSNQNFNPHTFSLRLTELGKLESITVIEYARLEGAEAVEDRHSEYLNKRLGGNKVYPFVKKGLANSQRPVLEAVQEQREEYDESMKAYAKCANMFFDWVLDLKLGFIYIAKKEHYPDSNLQSLILRPETEEFRDPLGIIAIWQYLQVLNVLVNHQQKDLIAHRSIHYTITAGLPYMFFKRCVTYNPQLAVGDNFIYVKEADAQRDAESVFISRGAFDKAKGVLTSMQQMSKVNFFH